MNLQKSKRQYKNLNNPGDVVIKKRQNPTSLKMITILANDNNVIGITKLDDQKLIGCANR